MQGHDITRWFTCFEIGCILHGLEEVGGTGKVSEILPIISGKVVRNEMLVSSGFTYLLSCSLG
jgi:hypothetical protein